MAAKKKTTKEEYTEKLKEIKQFLDLWLQYHRAYKRSFKGEDVTKEGEEEFLKLKSSLARRHVRLLESMGKDYISASSIRPVLSQTVTLTHMSRIRPEHYEKIENDWHETYIYLNESIGHLRYLIEGVE